ncbi:IS5 family transposase [Vulgatibacter sp.]|uniref:IS5 family transposase n=1 Tax=Vulgatibacter sp. TaxID=1971226 RepID=UPI0035617396
MLQGVTDRNAFSNEQWERMAPLVASLHRRGPRGRSDRRFVEAVVWLLRTGSPWRDLPASFGRWGSVYQRFRRWAAAGRWEALRQALGADRAVDELLLIDSTIVKAHPHAAGARSGQSSEALGRSRGGFTTKVHAVVSSGGRLVRYVLTGGAARFAFNQALRLAKDALEAKRRGEDVFVPWTGFDQINSINKWKRSAARQAFRIRNKTSGGSSAVAVGDAGSPRSIRLPRLGLLAVREDTRKLRRMIARGRAKILFATISHETGGRWTVSLNLEAAALHPANRPEVVAAPIEVPPADRESAPRVRAPRIEPAGQDPQPPGGRDAVHGGADADPHGRSLADSSWAKFADALTYKLQWRGGSRPLLPEHAPLQRVLGGRRIDSTGGADLSLP